VYCSNSTNKTFVALYPRAPLEEKIPILERATSWNFSEIYILDSLQINSSLATTLIDLDDDNILYVIERTNIGPGPTGPMFSYRMNTFNLSIEDNVTFSGGNSKQEITFSLKNDWTSKEIKLFCLPSLKDDSKSSSVSIIF